MRTTNTYRNILIMLGMLLCVNCLFVLFFIIDLTFFGVKIVSFTAIYGYLLYPLFSILYGIISFKLTNRIVFNNTLLLIFCGSFSLIFMQLGIFFQNNVYISDCSLFIVNAINAMPIVGLAALLSVLASFLISTIISVFLKLFNRYRKDTTNKQ